MFEDFQAPILERVSELGIPESLQFFIPCHFGVTGNWGEAFAPIRTEDHFVCLFQFWRPWVGSSLYQDDWKGGLAELEHQSPGWKNLN